MSKLLTVKCRYWRSF